MPTSRITDPETSREAANVVSDVSLTQERIASLLTVYGPMTDTQIEARYLARVRIDDWKYQSPQSLRSRRAELVKQKLVVFAEEFGKSPSGLRARIWKATN